MHHLEANAIGSAHWSRLERGAPFAWIGRSAPALGIAALLLFGRAGDAPAAVPSDGASDGATSVTPSTNGNAEPLQTSGPTISFTIDPTAHFDPKTGVATVSGTITCDNADFAQVTGQLQQSVGRTKSVEGSLVFSIDGAACDGTSQVWSAQVRPFPGAFGGGFALVFADATACALVGDTFQCALTPQQQVTIHLRGGAR